MPMPEQVTLREVYTLIEGVRDANSAVVAQLRAEIVTAVEKTQSHIDKYIETHTIEHDAHTTKHGLEQQARRSDIKWAVTSILTGCGVLAAIVIPILRS